VAIAKETSISSMTPEARGKGKDGVTFPNSVSIIMIGTS